MSLPILNFILIILLFIGFIITNKSNNNMQDNDMFLILNLLEKYEKQQKQIEQIAQHLNIEIKDEKEE